MMRRLAIVPLVVGALVAALVGTLVMPSPSSEAFWSARTSGGSSAAQATTVQQVGTPTATVANRNAITVSWPAAALSDGTAVTGYAVTRTDASGTSIAATGACAGVVAATSCTESDVPDGRWTYAVVARFGSSWVGPASAPSGTAIADTVAPSNALSISVTTGRAVLQGTTLWYRGAGNGELRIVNAVSDALSGPAGSSTGALVGTATGWSHIPTNVATPAGGPYASAPFAWDPGTSTSPTSDIVGFDVAGNQTATRVQLRDDSTPPSGGAIGYPSGTVRASSGSTASVSVTAASVSDPGGSGVVSRVIERRTATLAGDACGTFGSWTQFASTSATFQLVFDDAVAVGACAQYRHVITDAVGNVREASSTNVVKVKAQYATTVRSSPSLLHQYTFDGTGASFLADTPSGSNSGQTTSAQTTPTAAPGAIAGGGTAASFDGVDDFVRVSRSSIGASFSIELWFQSTQGLTTGQSGQWYHGAGLVDAETPGVQNDFGISLSADGRVLAGVGNPDTTIRSQAGLNDGRWHHVVMTRDQSSGLVTLYVDGVDVARYTAAQTSRQTLGASTYIDIGRLQTGMSYYRGGIDEVALYTAALTPAQVADRFGAR